MEVLLWERPRPTLGEAHWLFRFRRIFEPQSSLHGEYGCAYSLEAPPTTCANFLCCNRQIHQEMLEAIDRAKCSDRLAVKLDCIAEDESFHYLTWLGCPLVKTRYERRGWMEGMRRLPRSGWMGNLYGGLMKGWTWRTSTTRIHTLWIDIRLVGDRSAKWLRNSSPADRTSWAICAALKRIFDHGPNFSNLKEVGSMNTTVDELVLNVVPPSNVPASKYLDEDFPIDGTGIGLVHPRTVAKELIEVWQRIWAGDQFKGAFYQVLLEKISRVSVCIDGECWKTRQLRRELERGQKERTRIAARGVW